MNTPSEDQGFGEVLARARAKARGVEYVPGEEPRSPRTEADEKLDQLLERFRDSAKRRVHEAKQRAKRRRSR